MAKIMGQIQDGVVVNIVWCSDNQSDTDTLVDPGDRPVGIGDTYLDGQFYRDGKRILTPLEKALEEIERLKAENAAKDAEKADMAAALALLGVTEEVAVSE